MTLFYLTLLKNYEDGKPHPWKDAIVLNLAALALTFFTVVALTILAMVLL